MCSCLLPATGKGWDRRARVPRDRRGNDIDTVLTTEMRAPPSDIREIWDGLPEFPRLETQKHQHAIHLVKRFPSYTFCFKIISRFSSSWIVAPLETVWGCCALMPHSVQRKRGKERILLNDQVPLCPPYCGVNYIPFQRERKEILL